MNRHPLKPSAPVARHVFGGRRIPAPLGVRVGLPDGPPAGRRLRGRVVERPDEPVVRCWRGPR